MPDIATGPLLMQSANGAYTMEISPAVYQEGTPIVGSLPPGGPGTPLPPAQSWEVVSDPLLSSHFLIVNTASALCIGIGQNAVPQLNAADDVMDDATDRGAVLTLQVPEQVNNDYQLWDFLPVPDGAGSMFFIQNPATGYVIELASPSTVPGPLVANPRRIADNPFQLWTAVDQADGEVQLPVVPMAQYPGNLHGFDNYILVAPNQGDHLVGLTVTMDVIDDITTVDDAGFSLQINCNTPYVGPPIPYFDASDAVETYQTDLEAYEGDTEDSDRQAQWMQFGMFMQDSQLVLFNQIWHRLGPVPPSEFPSVTETSPPVLQLHDSTIPAGTRIIFNIITDHTDFAIGITGLALDATGRPIGPPVYWPALGQPTFHSTIDGGVVHQRAMAPIAALQVVIGSLPGAAAGTQFASGMGTLTVTASPGLAPPQESAPNPFGIATAENSDMPYDLVPDVAARLISQPFGLPAILPPPHRSPGRGESGYTEIIIEEPGGIVEVLPGIGGGPPIVFDDDPASAGDQQRP